VETKEKLNCRPCGLHGMKKCPEEHFKCATTININDLLE
jgi:heptosyltransferase-2